jgi:hypothetical protein
MERRLIELLPETLDLAEHLLDAPFDLVKEGVNLLDVVAKPHPGRREDDRPHICCRQRPTGTHR